LQPLADGAGEIDRRRMPFDRAFNRRTDELTSLFRIDMAAVLKDSASLGIWLEAKAAAR
jgi:hypothetical protein